MSQRQTADIVIVGGGVIGCVTAYYLTLRGFPPLVVEADAIASGASGMAAGILTPYSGSPGRDVLDLSPATLALHSQLSEALPSETGIDYGYDLRPHLRCAFTEEGIAGLKRWQKLRAAEGLETQLVTPEEARSMTPWLTGDILGALRCEIEPTVDAYRFTVSAAQAAERRGARFVTGRVVGLLEGPIRDGLRAAAGVRLADGQELASGNIILAMGPWAAEAAAWLDFPIPVEPQRGQMLYLAPPEPEDGPPLEVGLAAFDLGGSILPKKHTDTIIGATRESAGFDRRVTEEGRMELIEKTTRLSNRIPGARLSGETACLRPRPADGKPFVGPVPNWTGMYLSTGHWSEGIHFAPVTGSALAGLIADGDPDFDISALDPARVLEASEA